MKDWLFALRRLNWRLAWRHPFLAWSVSNGLVQTMKAMRKHPWP